MVIHLIFLFFSVVYSWDDSNLATGSLGGYFNMTEINKMLESLASTSVTSITAGQTEGGVDIKGVKVISTDGLDSTKRQKILVTGTHTTAQPLSATQVLYLLNYMINDASSDTVYLLQTSIFYFFPVINVDAYTKSYENYATTSSFVTYLKNTKSTCTSDATKSGVDLNANFGAYWGYDSKGSSDDTCSDTYRGTAAFSEKESSAIKSLLTNEGTFTMWIHYDNYGNKYFYPYSYTDGDMLKAFTGQEKYYSYYTNLATNATSLGSMTYGTTHDKNATVANGAIIDYGMNNTIISFLAAIGDKNTAKDAILSTCKTHVTTFKEIIMTSTPDIKLYLSSSAKVDCGTNCGDAVNPVAYSTLTFTLQNLGISDSYDSLNFIFKATYGSTYDYMVTNVTGGGGSLDITNVTDSAEKISFQVNIGSLTKLTNYTLKINLYSYKGASYNDEDMAITYTATATSSLSATKTFLTTGDAKLSGVTTPSTSTNNNNGSGAFQYIRVSSSHKELAAVAVISIFMGIIMIVIWVFIIRRFKHEKEFGSANEEHDAMSHEEINIKLDEKDTKNVTTDNINSKNEFPSRPGDDFKGLGVRNPNGFEVRNMNQEPKKFEFKTEARLPEDGSPGLKGRFGVSNPQPEIRGNFGANRPEGVEEGSPGLKGRFGAPNAQPEIKGNFGGYRPDVPEKQSPRVETVGFGARGNPGGLRAVEVPERQSPRVENPGFGRPDMRPGIQKIDISANSSDQSVNIPSMRGLPPKSEPELKGTVNVPSGFSAIPIESDAPKGKFIPQGREIPSHLKASPFGKEPQAKLGAVEEPQLPSFARQPTDPGMKAPLQEKQSLAPVYEADEPRPIYVEPQVRIGGMGRGGFSRPVEEPKPQFASPQFKGSIGVSVESQPRAQIPGAGINLGGPPAKSTFQPISAAFRADESSDDIQILAEENRWGDPPSRKIGLNSSSSNESF
ncbi:cpt_1 [Blepharisma stoltei]|uniref:Peptidase M14 domain-containing protein n=1 Tax=Blepharisma stoltei TaxID=1481888 RepID=A0AAU9IIN2_9CILI|nr:unnamed protein product [Blepharisma stoltei]